MESLKAYNHRKQNIRQALFIYLSITLNKLPASSDFWLSERSDSKRAFPDIPKHCLTGLEAFDQYYQREVTRAKMHVHLLYEGEVSPEGIGNLLDKEQYSPNTADIDFKLRLGTLVEILSGPRNVRAELEAVSKHLSELYLPKIEEIAGLFNMLEGSIDLVHGLSSSPISQAVKRLVQIGRGIRQSLEKQLGRQPGSEEWREECCDVDLLIKDALEFIVIVDKTYSDVTTLVDGISNMLENMSE